MSLNETFEIIDVTPEEIQSTDITIYDYKTAAPKINPIDSDYESARDNLYTIMSLGEEALVQALNIAKQSEHPRAFEVVGNIMKQLADINHQLLDLHKKKQSIVSEKEPAKTVTNNNMFVGSTAELAKMIANMKKGE